MKILFCKVALQAPALQGRNFSEARARTRVENKRRPRLLIGSSPTRVFPPFPRVLR